MKILKQLDKLVIKSFLGPYLIAFVVAEFVLVLQFVWRYIDDFIGRGVSPFIIMEMILYYGLTIIPLAVPISILISSVMVYGTMAEKYELTSFKSAGVSFFRIMRPGIVIAILTAIFSIFCSNFLKPKANLSFFQTFEDVRRAKPTLTIDQGIFNNDFKGYAIRVGKKGQDGKSIEDILIYDQTDRRMLGLITAKSGQMYISDDGQFFTMELNDGVQYSELERKKDNGQRDQDQFVRIYFEKFLKNFDMSEFEFSLSQNDLGRRRHDLYNSFQMANAMDSIKLKMEEQIDATRYYYGNLIPKKESPLQETVFDDDEFNEKEGNPENNDIVNNNLSDKIIGKEILTDPKSKIDSTNYINELRQNKYSPQSKSKANNTLNQENPYDSESTNPIKPSNLTLDKRSALEKYKSQQQQKSRVLQQQSKNSQQKADQYYNERISFRKDTIDMDTVTSFIATIKDSQQKNILFRAKSTTQTTKERYRTLIGTIQSSNYNRNKFQHRLHQQFCWAFICIVFMFIGAPLGSIVRKGGFGYPLLIAIIFFVIFVFTNIMGEKLVTSGSLRPIIGAWLPCVLLVPIAIYFTLVAIKDAKFNFNLFSWSK